jgi:hypothetical protein
LRKTKIVFIKCYFQGVLFWSRDFARPKNELLGRKTRKNKNKNNLKQIKYSSFWSCELSKTKKRFLDKKEEKKTFHFLILWWV